MAENVVIGDTQSVFKNALVDVRDDSSKQPNLLNWDGLSIPECDVSDAKTYICIHCYKRFLVNGIRFKLPNGEIRDICNDCIKRILEDEVQNNL